MGLTRSSAGPLQLSSTQAWYATSSHGLHLYQPARSLFCMSRLHSWTHLSLRDDLLSSNLLLYSTNSAFTSSSCMASPQSFMVRRGSRSSLKPDLYLSRRALFHTSVTNAQVIVPYRSTKALTGSHLSTDFSGLAGSVQPCDVLALSDIYMGDFLTAGPQPVIQSFLDTLRRKWTCHPVTPWDYLQKVESSWSRISRHECRLAFPGCLDYDG